MRIRAIERTDIDAIYAIALRTGASGQDATHLYSDGNLAGLIWAAPYALLEPGSCFVVEDESGVGGYIVGAIDTRAFDARLEAQWWPTLRTRYADPLPKPAAQWSAHFAVSPANARALAFYRTYGFVELPRATARPHEPVWFAMRLA